MKENKRKEEKTKNKPKTEKKKKRKQEIRATNEPGMRASKTRNEKNKVLASLGLTRRPSVAVLYK